MSVGDQRRSVLAPRTLLATPSAQRLRFTATRRLTIMQLRDDRGNVVMSVAVAALLLSVWSCARVEHAGPVDSAGSDNQTTRVEAAIESPPPEPRELVWSGLAECYEAGSHIRASVVNRSSTAIYLGWFWPEPSGQFHRFNEIGSHWVPGDHGITCGTVVDPTKPRELPAGARLEVAAYNCFIKSRDGLFEFRPERSVALTYPAEGIYKLTLNYARKPWVAGNTPKQILKTESPVFRIASNCGA